MALKNERIIYVAKNFTTGLADVTADIRRDGVSVATGVAMSDIGNGRYQLLLTPALLAGYGGAGFYDFYIDSASRSAPATTAKWILENDSDNLETHLGAIETKIDTVDTVVDGIASDVTSVKATVESTNTEINDAGHGLANLKTLIDAVTSIATNISNVTRFSAPIPKPLIRQETGNKSYKIPCFLYDADGNMEDPDTNQIQLQVTNEAGISKDSLITGFTAQPHYITRNATGQYEFELDVPDTASLEQINFKFTYAENAITLVHGATSEIIQEAAASGLALETTAQSILTDTADMQPRVADIQATVNHVTYGLSALKTLLDTIDGNTDTIEASLANATYGLSALRTQLDLKSSQSSVNTANAALTAIKGAGYVEADDSLEAISDRSFTGGLAV